MINPLLSITVKNVRPDCKGAELKGDKSKKTKNSKAMLDFERTNSMPEKIFVWKISRYAEIVIYDIGALPDATLLQ
ncbi:hypothetical protein [Porphyromonas macacae]|uniref:hypothetical protein n=1 Tax=Porphyromonas macacae TaxID=28115 RepID=UPI0024AE6BBE|nr:hypothetical protein [Porphyromonas macacae]